MLKECIVTLGAFALIGCGGELLSNPIVEQALAACEDVPVEEAVDCFKDNLANRPDSSGVTVGDLLERLRDSQGSTEEPVE